VFVIVSGVGFVMEKKERIANGITKNTTHTSQEIPTGDGMKILKIQGNISSCAICGKQIIDTAHLLGVDGIEEGVSCCSKECIEKVMTMIGIKMEDTEKTLMRNAGEDIYVTNDFIKTINPRKSKRKSRQHRCKCGKCKNEVCLFSIEKQ
jgi:hypothetical protein